MSDDRLRREAVRLIDAFVLVIRDVEGEDEGVEEGEGEE